MDTFVQLWMIGVFTNNGSNCRAVFVSTIDTTLPLSRKAYVLIDLPSLESVTGSIWTSDGRSDDAVVLQCAEFADWLDSSCKCLWWRLLQLQQLSFEGHSFEECLIQRQLKQAFSWYMASLSCLTNKFLHFSKIYTLWSPSSNRHFEPLQVWGTFCSSP